LTDRSLPIDPGLIAVGAGLLCAVCGYGIGSNALSRNNERAIEDTIIYLCENGYVKHRELADGEVEIIPLDGEV
jgi:hypothetical protein